MGSSAPQSPAHSDGSSHFEASLDRPSLSKSLRINGLMGRAASLSPRRLSSPAKKKQPQTRPRLNQYHTLDHAVSLFKTSQNIIVLTGAGISTSLGVPDFRSANGVYNMLVDSVYDDPQELFHIDNFKADPKEFFKQAAKVFPKMLGLETSDDPSTPWNRKYSLTHAFVSLLHAKGKLLTNYTQNIDGLESVAGIPASSLIQCHGTIATATCMSCGKRTTARKYMLVVETGEAPLCKCSLLDNEAPKHKPNRPRGRTGQQKKRKRKRDEFEDSNDEAEDIRKADFPKGLWKPDMTFFGEGIADTYAPRLQVDKSKVDLLVIIGTSLKVEPVNEMLLNIPPTVPQIWISKDRCQREGVKVDIELLGECDLVLEEVARRAGWEDALHERRCRSSSKPIPQETPKPATRPAQKERNRSQIRDDKIKERNGSPQKMRALKQEDRRPFLPSEKVEQPLQIRKKSYDSPSLAQKPPYPPIIKINDHEVPSRRTPDIEPDGTKNDTLASRAALVEKKPIEGARKEENGALLARTSMPPSSSPPPRVIVDLEAGTRNRWYIRRPKPGV